MSFKKAHRDYRSKDGLKAMADKLSKARTGDGNPMFGKKPWNFKGRSLTSDGYWAVAVNGKRVREHRLIMENMIGRKLEAHEIVHHLDGDKRNNVPSNLILLQSNKEHRSYHALAGGDARYA